MIADELTLQRSGVEPAKLQHYAALLGRVFGEGPRFTPQALAWRYRDNPAGQVVGMDAWAGERLAAHYVTCPLTAVVDGASRKGLLSLNTATDPDFQGRGLFTRLAEATYAAGAAAGYDFVLGVANANSTPGFVRKLGFQLVTPLAAGVLARRPRRFRPAEVQFEGQWNPADLAWRLANPAGRYVTARSGRLTAVWARTHLPGVACAAFLDDAPADGHAPLAASLFIGLEPRLDLKGLGFIPIPKRLRPSPLNLIWRPLSGNAPQRLEPGAAAISFLDFDPY